MTMTYNLWSNHCINFGPYGFGPHTQYFSFSIYACFGMADKNKWLKIDRIQKKRERHTELLSDHCGHNEEYTHIVDKYFNNGIRYQVFDFWAITSLSLNQCYRHSIVSFRKWTTNLVSRTLFTRPAMITTASCSHFYIGNLTFNKKYFENSSQFKFMI